VLCLTDGSLGGVAGDGQGGSGTGRIEVARGGSRLVFVEVRIDNGKMRRYSIEAGVPGSCRCRNEGRSKRESVDSSCERRKEFSVWVTVTLVVSQFSP
jgi:hypothetical protein